MQWSSDAEAGLNSRPLTAVQGNLSTFQRYLPKSLLCLEYLACSQTDSQSLHCAATGGRMRDVWKLKHASLGASIVSLPGHKEVEHSQGHEGDTDVEGHAHRSVLLEDFLQLLRLAWFFPLWLRLVKKKTRAKGEDEQRRTVNEQWRNTDTLLDGDDKDGNEDERKREVFRDLCPEYFRPNHFHSWKINFAIGRLQLMTQKSLFFR